eukprot:281597-Pelagomonas_calceolata.AAC.1
MEGKWGNRGGSKKIELTAQHEHDEEAGGVLLLLSSWMVEVLILACSACSCLFWFTDSMPGKAAAIFLNSACKHNAHAGHGWCSCRDDNYAEGIITENKQNRDHQADTTLSGLRHLAVETYCIEPSSVQ